MAADIIFDQPISVFAITAAVGAIVLLLVLLCGIMRKDNSTKKDDATEDEDISRKTKEQQQRRVKEQPHKGGKRDARSATITHPWLAGSLKGHTGLICGIDFSPNGKYMVSCAGDRTVLLWSTKDFAGKEHRSVRANVEYDHATKIKFSPDNKAFIVSLHNANKVQVFKFGKKEDGSLGNIQPTLDFPKKHDADIINIGIANNGRFIMTCSADTSLKIWDLKGDILAAIDTLQMQNSYALVSPCGRFVAASGFSPDVKVWEVCFDKGDAFTEVIRAFELKGHSAGIHSFAFNNDSSRMATVSKDSTWKLWNTQVEYQKRQDAQLLATGKYDYNANAPPSLIALSPDGRTVAIATGSNVSFFDAATADCVEQLQDIFAGLIVALEFTVGSRMLAVAGDRCVLILHNVAGLQANIRELEEKRRKSTTHAMSERLAQQIEESRKELEKLGIESS